MREQSRGVSARCANPVGHPLRRMEVPGRSLQADSDVRRRGMTVPPATADRIRLTGPTAYFSTTYDVTGGNRARFSPSRIRGTIILLRPKLGVDHPRMRL